MFVARSLSLRPLNPFLKMATISTLSSGSCASASLKVTSSDLAQAISIDPEDKFPAVFATARLVALMEIACARVLKPSLLPGQLSVGVSIDMSHSAPTPLGAIVTAEATYRGKEGKTFLFDVVATDEGGDIGKAVHKRAIVDVERLESGALKRVPTN